MPKIKTPLLRTLRKTGATMYAFPSAAEDISLNINTGSQGVALSHYALLNLTKNNFNFTNPTDIVRSLQNGLMNNEVVLLNQDTYNFQEPYTVSEHVFWKWLMDHSKNKSGEQIFNLDENTAVKNVYREKNCGWENADRIVQCFGVIDSGNNLSTDFGMFNETYINIPSSYGNGPVFFRSTTDNVNYKKNINIRNKDFIEGRDDVTRTYIEGDSPLKPEPSDSTVEDYGLEIVKDVYTIQKVCSDYAKKNLIISSFDDVNIDSLNQFKDLPEYNINSKMCEFKFNAILLYYSIYNLNDLNKEPVATNLFGIIFLDGGYESEESDPYLITPVVKKKSYRSQEHGGGGYFGSGYSFRVNIKTMSVYDNTDARIEDNTTATSMYAQDFNDVISNLNRAVDAMYTNMYTTANIQSKYIEMQSEFVNFKQRLDTLYNDLSNSLDDKITQKIDEVREYIDSEIQSIRSELELYNETDPTDESSVPIQMVVTKPALKHLATRMQVSVDDSKNTPNVYGAARTAGRNERAGLITDSRIDVVSATSANINASDIINITGRDINLNFKSDGKVSKVPVSGIIERINNIERKLYNERDMSVEKVIAMGIIPIVGILQPRAKKPEVPGLYLKQNTAGNITQYVVFDGEEYKELFKCEKGKMYSVQGTIYSFNGETCKLFGDF